MHDSEIEKYAVHCPTDAEADELIEYWTKLGYIRTLGGTGRRNRSGLTYYRVDDGGIIKQGSIAINTFGRTIITFAQYKANGFKFEGVTGNNEGVNNHANPSHYTDAGIEPWEVLRRYKGKFPTTHEAGLFAQVIQYLMRSPFKGQYLGDINKAKNLLIEWENYANNTGNNSDSNGTDKADV